MKIAVIGGGVGGHLIAHKLQQDHQVVLIEPRDHLVIPIAMPRVLVDPQVAERALVPYADFLPEVDHRRARAMEVHTDHIVLQGLDGEPGRIEADAFVLATGSRYPGDEPALFPPHADRTDRLAAAARFREGLTQATSVLILGGGPVGVEVAGELAADLPHLSVTLIDPGDRLLPGTSARAGDLALGWLRDHGVDVRLGESFELSGEQRGGPVSGTTSTGHPVRADVALAFYGYRPVTEPLAPLGSELLDANGRVRTRPTLQIHGHDHILAIGDLTDFDERKLAMYAAKHADVAVATLRALAAGRVPTQTYTPGTGEQTMLVTLGRTDGVCHLPMIGAVRLPLLARMLKSGDVMVGKYRRRVGLD